MSRSYRNRRGSSRKGSLVVIAIVILLFVVGYIFYKDHQKTSFTTTSVSTNKTVTPTGPYFGWKSYSDTQLALQYPGGWNLTENVNSKVGIYSTSPNFLARSAGMTGNSADSVASLFIQIGTHSSTSWCQDITCKVAALIPLSSAQLSNDDLALINQSGQAGNTTVFAVTTNATSIGSTSVNPAVVGDNLSITGYPEYVSSNLGSTVVARITDFASFQANSNVTDLVLILNSIKFK